MMVRWWRRVPSSVALFLFFFSIYTFTLSGIIEYGDDVEKYKVAQAIVERHDLAVRRTAVRNVVGLDSRTYSVYELGQTLAEVPFYLLGRLFTPLSGISDPNWILMLFVGWLNPLLTALTCVLLFKLCSRLGYSFRAALALAFVFGLATIAWPYAHGFTREPLIAILLLGAGYAAIRYAQTGAAAWLLATSFVLGALIFTKFINVIFLPAFFVYVAYAIYKNFNSRQPAANLRKIAGAAALGLVPLALILASQAVYGLVRFGSPLSGLAGGTVDPLSTYINLAQRGNLITGIVGLLLTPDKSILAYSPPLLLFLPAIIGFYSKHKAEAFLIAASILSAFLVTAARPDWDGGSWWGPRYLVPLTALFILPIGVLFQPQNYGWRRFWKALLLISALLGIAVQCAGAFVSNRIYLDITGQGIHLFGGLDFLRHGALDSLMLYLSPTGSPIQINPYGILLISAAALFGIWIVQRIRGAEGEPVASTRSGAAVLALVLLIEFVTFIVWIVAPYSRVLAAEANTKFVAGNLFLADGRRCEAAAMYRLALERGTTYQREAVARLDELTPQARGVPISADDLMAQMEMPDNATVDKDETSTIRGEGSLKMSLPMGSDAIVMATSNPIGVQPNTTYELSGWMKTEAIYGSGYAAFTIFEDDGNWANGRTTDIVLLDETHGWQPFWKSITTRPTTRRIFVKASLWKTYGTVWVDGIQLAQITEENTPLANLPTACK